MARVFITGSADGLGSMAARWLISQGHDVVLHARNAKRGSEAMLHLPGAERVLTADLSSLEETIKLAGEINAAGTFDAVIHNAGVYRASNEMIFAVNSLAPYVLTCLVQKPRRLIYLSSSMHMHGDPNLKSLKGENKGASYSDSKFHDLLLCMAVARKWPGIYANAVDPGWVPTKMGGPGAPDSLEKGYQTQAWLAVSNDPEAKVTGRYFYHQKIKHHRQEAGDAYLQEQFLALCEQISGVKFPVDQG
jgi:NAD(P)-dependent dehydrogenase (short-subunit alcohol dehydrogenase family)